MKEITILSGKGGAGKTSITAALASLAHNAVYCDNDVDAADLHLLLTPEIYEEHTFYSSWIASIDNEKCTRCGICKNYCRFDAIHFKSEGGFEINPFQCEGCRLCERVCPVQAIHSERNSNNQWFVSNTRFGTLVHARMGPGEENSGKLVTQVRKRAKEIASEINAAYVINDGPPGIGCAAISSITGANAILLVIEPTKSGVHDAKRLVELVNTFGIPMFALINKANISSEIRNELVAYLSLENIPLVAELPFDTSMVEAMVNEQTIVEYQPGSEISIQLQKVWDAIKN